jgi:hypothetical protein
MTTQTIDYDVSDYRTGDSLVGPPSVDLVRESLDAGPEGAVHAYYDGEEWIHVAADRVAREEARGNTVRVVFVTAQAQAAHHSPRA